MYRFHPSRGSIALTERIKRLVLMAFILVSVPVFASASQLTGIPIPQGNVLQQLVTGQSYNVTCTGGGVYFRGWTGGGGGYTLQNNCGAGFSQSLSPAVYQFAVQDSSGFNNIETFNVEVVSANYCQNGAGDYPTCSPPVVGCRDSRAINYVASSTVDSACTYPFKSFTQGWTEPITRFGSGLITPSIDGFSYATETYSGTPYLTNGVNPVTSVGVSVRYAFSSTINTLYIVATGGFYAGNYVRGCDGTYLGGGTRGMTAVGNSFLTPDEVTVQVYKVVVTPAYGGCVGFNSFVQTPSAPANMRVYSVWAGADEISIPTSFLEVQTQASSTIISGASPTFIATTTLPDCGITNIGCHMANAFAYVFTPDPNAVNRFKSLTLASSSPFSYAYDMKNVYTEFFSTASSAELGLTVNTGIGAITFISKAKVEAVPYAGFVKTLIGWLLWFMFANLVYNQILRVHNKEHTT